MQTPAAPAQHTPGPWHVSGATGFAHVNGGNPSRPIADCSFGRPSAADTEDRANAAFIVRACNAHDDMLTALRAIVENNPGERPSGWLETARAAIAKAEGLS